MTTRAALPRGFDGPARDPLAMRRVTTLLIGMVVLWPLLVLAEFKPWALFDANNLRVMASFLADRKSVV